MFCAECGYLDIAHHDGYGFGDRLLEGVLFEVSVVGDKLITSGVTATHQRYFSDLNTTKWLAAANESLRDVEEEAGIGLRCPNHSHHEVILINDDGSDYVGPTKPAPKKKRKVRVFKGSILISDYEKELDG